MKEHKFAVKTRDRKNGVAVHAWDRQHRVDWEGATVVEHEQSNIGKGEPSRSHLDLAGRQETTAPIWNEA